MVCKLAPHAGSHEPARKWDAAWRALRDVVGLRACAFRRDLDREAVRVTNSRIGRCVGDREGRVVGHRNSVAPDGRSRGHRRPERKEVCAGARPRRCWHARCGHHSTPPGANRGPARCADGAASSGHVAVRRRDRQGASHRRIQVVVLGLELSCSSIHRRPSRNCQEAICAQARSRPQPLTIHAGGAQRRALTAPSTDRDSNA